MQNAFRKCKQPWNMFEMGRSNALIRIRGKTCCTHFKIERTTAQKHTLPPLFKTKTDKRGIEFGIYFAYFQKEQPKMKKGRIEQG